MNTVFWLLFSCVFLRNSVLAKKNAVPIDRQQQTTYDVIVVGAGLTGLSAARLIQQTRPELSVLILEARGQVGGRVRYSTMQTRNGVEFVDIGAQLISPTDDELLRLIGELKIEISQQLVCGNNTLYQDRVKRNSDSLLATSQGAWKATQFTDMILNEAVVGNLTTQSVTQFAQNLSTNDSDTVNRLLQTFFDAPAEQTSSIQLALTCSSQNATINEILRRYGHGESFLAKGGMNEVVRRLADGLLIEYGQKVKMVNDAISPAMLTTSTGVSYSARQVILAVPIATLSNINILPTPEAPFEQLINNYGTTGHAYYFTMTFQRPTWRLNGKSGKVIYTSQNGPLVWMTTFDTTYGTTCDNSTGTSSTLWGIAHFSYEVPFETRKRLYTQGLQYSFRFADFSPLDISDISFTNDVLAKGSIPTLRVNIPFESLRYLNDFHTIYQNVHISTADIASVSLGTMNGAVHAGQMVAAYTLAMLTSADVTSNNNLLRDQPLESTTPFVYRTTSHYPPEIFEEKIDIQQTYSDQQSQEQSSTFKYETSSHYPPTTSIPTTTIQHFSFGNLNSSDSEVLAVVQHDQQQQSQNNNTNFEYSTSSVMPPAEPIETTTYIHFSNGNLGSSSAPANIQRDPGVLENTSNNLGDFAYSTSTHYPLAAAPSSDPQNATPSSQIVAELRQVSENAQNTTALDLAQHLTSLVHTILSGLRLQ
ncbi:unnamed protein product [Caenorhabditis angaria]|uniref:Amine oxidase n=1 Tax=Caenorhabditis angaria TaxID=860376 RepID=A0A9P1I4T9_9PELO|nr:unnamed protein product [Caenorhabditis angaria]